MSIERAIVIAILAIVALVIVVVLLNELGEESTVTLYNAL